MLRLNSRQDKCCEIRSGAIHAFLIYRVFMSFWNLQLTWFWGAFLLDVLCFTALSWNTRVWGLSLGSFQGFRVPVFYSCRQPIGLVWFPSFDGEGWPLHAACSSGKDGQVVPLSFPVPNAWRVLLPTQWTCLAEAHLLLIWIKHHKVTEDTKMMFPTAVLVWALCRKGLGLTRVEYSEKMLLKHFRLELCWVCITG